MQLKYYKNLDGLRAIAVLMVMFFHYFNTFNISASNPILKIYSFGQTGVTLFFVLSGFLITRILLATKNGANFFKKFYIRRALRIFPLYYLYLFLSYYIFPFIFNTVIPPIDQQMCFYTYLQNFAITFKWPANGPGHFWSLAVEEHFYLFWPFVIFFLDKKKLIYLIVGIVLFALFLRVVMLANNLSVFYFTFTRFDSLAIGSLLALLENSGLLKKVNPFKFLILAFVFILPIILFVVLFSNRLNFTMQLLKDPLISLFYFFIIGFMTLIDENNFINKILKSTFLVFIGKISYGMYVFHPFIFMLVHKHLSVDSSLSSLSTSFSSTIFISTLSFYFFESYFLRIKQKFT